MARQTNLGEGTVNILLPTQPTARVVHFFLELGGFVRHIVVFLAEAFPLTFQCGSCLQARHPGTSQRTASTEDGRG